jgi:hypothetical protein
MTRLGRAKKLKEFDPNTFLSTIDSGRKIVAFPKKQTIFTQGDSSDAVLLCTERKGKTHCCVDEREGSDELWLAVGAALLVLAPLRWFLL